MVRIEVHTPHIPLTWKFHSSILHFNLLSDPSSWILNSHWSDLLYVTFPRHVCSHFERGGETAGTSKRTEDWNRGLDCAWSLLTLSSRSSLKGEMGSIMKTFIFLALTVHLAAAASHSLQYFYTAVTPGINFPEFTTVGQVDGGQFVYYDSDIRKMIPKTEWIEKNEGEDYWTRETQIQQGTQEVFKVDVGTLKQRFNQSDGVHTWQWMYGCELHDDGTNRGYDQFGYDGEDFVSLDLKTLTWTAANAKAVITKHKWERTAEAARHKAYLENTCIDWIKKYVEYGRSTLERKVSPEVSLFQKDSSSPVVCHATGFFPKAVMISWQKNGEDLHEDMALRETLPNQDGTFQKRSVLTVSPEELNRHDYTCIIQHSSLEKEMMLPVIERRLLTPGGGESVGLIIAMQRNWNLHLHRADPQVLKWPTPKKAMLVRLSYKRRTVLLWMVKHQGKQREDKGAESQDSSPTAKRKLSFLYTDPEHFKHILTQYRLKCLVKFYRETINPWCPAIFHTL
ncbi:hypothetical protein SRHO_G00258140 [Serrasalmus rhombeus]